MGEFNDKIIVDVETVKLRKIYDRLEAEETPYEANIKHIGRGVKQLTIYCDTENVGHFNKVIADEN